MRLTQEWCALAAGWIAAAAVVWTIVVPPPTGKAYLFRILWTCMTTALVALWGAAMTYAVRRIVPPPDDPQTPEPALPWRAMYAFFGAATLLIAQFTFTGVAAGVLILLLGIRLVYPIAAGRGESPPPELFGNAELPVGVLTRHFGTALLIAFVCQLAVTALVAGKPTVAAALLSLDTLLLGGLASVAGGWSAGPSPKTDRALVSLACFVTIAILVAVVPFGEGEGAEGAATGPHTAQTAEPPQPAEGDGLPGDYPGVILWPEARPVTLLVDPLQAVPGTLDAAPRAMSVPFGGEYWMYRYPYPRPPANSHLRRGSPSALSFRTTDSVRLRMEARQKLERPIAVSCCGSLEVHILNADRHPGTVSLEVVLISARGGEQSLGLASVASRADTSADPPAPVAETLLFRFPASAKIEWFDEIRTVFHTSYRRMDRSAQVSIERFRFVRR